MSTHYINGEWIAGDAAGFSSHNPATNETLWEGNAASDAQVQSAVQAAHDAFPAWAATSLEERIALLTAFTSRIEAKKDELALLIAQETGKVLWDAQGEAAATIGKLKFSLKAYDQRSAITHNDLGAVTASLRHRPHGVMAVYGPYNFPSHLPNGHIIPGLLAGNTIVFKPSEQTPMVAQWYVKQWEAVDLPHGVLNLVQGEKEVGIALSNANIHGLLFTGSSATGKLLHQQFAGRPEVLLALELGGNNPLIVHDIIDIDTAIYETIQSAFIAAGQRCTCARRLIVTDGPYRDAFLKRLVEVTQSLAVGAYNETPEPFMGPLISITEQSKIIKAYEHLLSLGATSLLAPTTPRDGLSFITPAICDVTDLSVPDAEYFGPLLQVIQVATLDDAIAAANSTAFGLSSAILSNDRAVYKRCLREVRAGLMNWNKPTTGASGMAPFGGVGLSGNHHPAGYYAADYCAYPVASMESDTMTLPETLSPGITL